MKAKGGSKRKFQGLRMNSVSLRPSHFDCLLLGKKNLVGVEIGVYAADHALAILEQLDIKRLYLVDPYILYKGYAGLGIRGWRSLPEIMIYAKRRIKAKGYDSKARWLIMFSNEAVGKVKEKLDFVYIDGNHDYGYVMDDITKWEPKVKKGGLIGGHDYSPSKFGVYEAVNDYCTQHQIDFQVAGEEWFFWKK